MKTSGRERKSEGKHQFIEDQTKETRKTERTLQSLVQTFMKDKEMQRRETNINK